MRPIVVITIVVLAATAALADDPKPRSATEKNPIIKKHHPYRYRSYYQYDCLCGPEYYPSVPADYISRSVPGCNGIGC